MQVSRDVVVDTGVEADFCNLGPNLGPDTYGLGLEYFRGQTRPGQSQNLTGYCIVIFFTDNQW